MGREASQVLTPPQSSCESSVIADAHRIRDEFFNTIGQEQPVTANESGRSTLEVTGTQHTPRSGSSESFVCVDLSVRAHAHVVKYGHSFTAPHQIPEARRDAITPNTKPNARSFAI